MTLSVCMVVRNEEEMLAQALDSINGLADEIIVVDTGSTDKTKEIARGYTDKVYDFVWCDDFSKARNFSLSKATGDWILVLDADEVIAREDHDTIRALMRDQHFIGYAFRQVSYTNDLSQYHYTPLIASDSFAKRYDSYRHGFSGYISCHIIRLFRSGHGIHFEGAVHESVDASCKQQGEIMKTELWLHHYQFERGIEFVKQKQLHYLGIYEKNLASYPDQARAHRDIASIYYTYCSDYEKARYYFEKSLALNDTHKKTYVGLGLCYLQQQRFHDALQIFTRALVLFPPDEQLLQLKKYSERSIERFIKE